MEKELIEKSAVGTVGLTLIVKGADIITQDVVAGAIVLGAGFGCMLITIYLIEKQIAQSVMKLLKK